MTVSHRIGEGPWWPPSQPTRQGRPYADATDAAALGPASLEAPRRGGRLFTFARYSWRSRNVVTAYKCHS